MQPDVYLTTEQAAAYLNLKERKLYELAAGGEAPCSKVTGKWLFPRAALDQWIASGLRRPDGFVAQPPPPIIGGSHDPLLEWLARRSGSGLALMPEGSEAGLERLARNEIAMAAIHLHGPAGGGADVNAAAVAATPGLNDAVLIGFVRREQGLVLATGNPLRVCDIGDALGRGVRFGLRQKGAGAQLLLEQLMGESGAGAPTLNAAPEPYLTGNELALAIRAGDIDCGLATRSVAQAHGLGFVPVVWERFDLALRRRSYFEPGAQKFFAGLRESAFARQAEIFGGYDLAEAGRVRFNA
jgi:putative molybdopterin biosynthesis protein